MFLPWFTKLGVPLGKFRDSFILRPSNSLDLHDIHELDVRLVNVMWSPILGETTEAKIWRVERCCGSPMLGGAVEVFI